MKMSKKISLIVSVVSILAIVLLPEDTLAWGARGHHTICSSAPHLIKDESLKSFLKYRVHTMGHLCNIPDIHWKSLGPEVSDIGNPTHYIDPELIGLKVTEIPLDIQTIINKYTGTDNLYKNKGKIFSIPKEFGTLWWRADQFVRMIADLKSSFGNIELPKNFKEEQDDKLPYNKAVYTMMIYMGVMGHYVGDASQPFHATADYDGYGTGNGGIHSYYEEQVVGVFGPDMEKLIVDKANTIKDKKLVSGTPIEIMQRLSELGNIDRVEALKLDPIVAKSEIKNDKGMDIKTAARRSSVDVGFKKYKNMIVTQMARSAIVLAHFWDESYNKASSPSLQAYKSFRYPHTPEFIAPDYVPKMEPKK